MYECMNCGGELRFDIPSQKLICAHCGGRFEPDEYDRDLFAEADQFEVNVFKCPNCGGEITSANLSAVEYCPYCGRFSMPASVKGSEKMPDEIMPFEITADEAKEAYRKYVGPNFYAPSKMKDDSFLSGFRGLYLPFWSYDVSFAKRPTLTKSYEHRSGDYIIKDTYGFSGDMDASYEGVTYDASSRFDDDLSRKTLPYMKEKVRPFNPSYMFGFYGETADVPSETYEKDAAEAASRDVFSKIDAEFPEDKLEFPENSFSKAYAFGARADNARLTMAPVWFLTWRHHDNVAYSVVNGQTGKTYADIPVSITKFLIGTLLLTVPLFALFYFALPTPSIYTMLLAVSLIGLVSLIFYRRGSFEIFAVREHLRDKGYLKRFPPDFDPEQYDLETKSVLDAIRKIDFSTLLFGFLLFFSFGGASILTLFIESMTRRRMRTAGYLVMAAFMVYYIYRILKSDTAGNKKQTFIDIGGAVFALAAAFVIHLVNPSQDAVYYLAALFVIGGVLWTLLMLIRQYNRMATHPDPHFFAGRNNDLPGVPLTQQSSADAPLNRRSSAAGKGRSDFAKVLIGLIIVMALITAVPILMKAGPKKEWSSGYSQGTYEIYLKDSGETAGETAFEGIVYTNEATGYGVRIEDLAGLIEENEKAAVVEAMIPVTDYGNAAFYTKTDRMDTESAIKEAYRQWFGRDSGTVFLIDMGQRNIWIHSNGALHRTVTKEWADVITDNTYRLATAGRYGDCAVEVFREILTRLEGGRVNNGLKIGTGLLIAFLISMLLNYLLILRSRNKRSAVDRFAPLMGASAIFAFTGATRRLSASNRRYSPVRSGGSSGGGFGGGGGGGSGGGGGGGGGGHGF